MCWRCVKSKWWKHRDAWRPPATEVTPQVRLLLLLIKTSHFLSLLPDTRVMLMTLPLRDESERTYKLTIISPRCLSCAWVIIMNPVDFQLHSLYRSPNIVRMIKSRRLRLAGHVARMEEDWSVFKILTGKPTGKRPLGRARRRWGDNIRMDLEEIGINTRMGCRVMDYCFYYYYNLIIYS